MADLVRERYEPIECVGAGGQGEVWRARDHQHDRTVALKVRALTSDDEREAILSEARILLGLEPHANLPLVREDFFEDERYYLVVDWIEGDSLQSVADQRGRLSLDDMLSYLRPVADALDHLHRHDPPVVHGDVKPANVILTPAGRAVLVDFGIAAVGGGDSRAGTVGYAAPEGPSSPAADVFGLAATAFALLSGGAPGSGARPGWLDLPRELAKRIDVMMRRALSVDPSRRPGSATELIEGMATAPDIPNNLPLLVSSFVGREHEIEDVKAALSDSRLVTLAAAGGIGKTRLGIQAASELLEDFADGCWLAELAALTDPSLVPAALASALGVREEPGREIGVTLIDHVRARRLVRLRCLLSSTPPPALPARRS